jgi:hypothetical protein
MSILGKIVETVARVMPDRDPAFEAFGDFGDSVKSVSYRN